MPLLSLSLFGPLRIDYQGQPIPLQLWIKTQALLSYLVLEAGLPHRRETLAGLLWPDCPEKAARSSLRQALHQLRSALGADTQSLVITAQTVLWLSAQDDTDVGKFLALVDACRIHTHSKLEECAECAGRLARAASLYGGDLLTGFGLKDCIAFEEWLAVKRERLRQAALLVLEKLADYYERVGDYERMEQAARREVEIDPLREIAYRQVMRALAYQGRSNEALHKYETLSNQLRLDLGVEPEADTRALYEQLRILRARLVQGSQSPGPNWPRPETAPPDRPVFVSRHKEMRFLQQAFQRACSGQGQVILITGEAGWGKTALINEFVRRILEQDRSVVVASASGMAYTGIGDPYHLFGEILRQLTGEVADQVSTNGIDYEQAQRLWRLMPAACQAILADGADLVGSLLPGGGLAHRASAFAAQESVRRESGRQETERPAWLANLLELIERRSDNQGRLEIPQQAHLFEQYIRMIKRLASRQPLVLILDDLQWSDEGSISLLFQLGRQLNGSRVLLVGAYRPSEVFTGFTHCLPGGKAAAKRNQNNGHRHPLEAVLHEFSRLWGKIEMTLDGEEDRAFIHELLDSEPNRLGEAFRVTLFHQTRACPLFTVELLRGMQERGDLVQDASGCWVTSDRLDWETLPARVEAVIAERIRRLPEPLVDILKIASVEGEIFTAEVAAQVLRMDIYQVIRMLGDLGRQHRLVFSRGSRTLAGYALSIYQFRHILFQRYLYQGLDLGERVHLHARIAEALEALSAGAPDEVVVQLAWHYQQARVIEKSIGYLQKAGEKATRVAAHVEAIAHFTRALDLLAELPESAMRSQMELPLRINLAVSSQIAKGFGDGEVGRSFRRALDLCQQMGDTPQTFTIQWQVARYISSQCDLKTSKEIIMRITQQAERQGDSLQIALGHWGLGWHQFLTGDYGTALTHLRYMLDIYHSEQHHTLSQIYGEDPGVTCYALAGLIRMMQGYPEEGSDLGRKAVALAETLADAYSLTLSLAYRVLSAAFSRDFSGGPDSAQAVAEECLRIAEQHGFSYWLYAGNIMQAWCTIETGMAEQGIRLLETAVEKFTATGAVSINTHPKAVMASAYGKIGQVEQGLAILEEALAQVNQTGEHYYTVEIYRVMGDLLLQKGAAPVQVDAAYRKAIDLARQQGARLWEIRAAVSLCRFWLAQGCSDQLAPVRQMLETLYSSFNEGLSLPDLREACELLSLAAE